MRGKDRATAPRALQREATRRALVRAAFSLAAKEGADPLDPASVALEAGVSRPLFYRYYPSRAEFVDALLNELHGGPPQSEPPSDASAAERLLAFFVRLSAPLDASADLARALIPRSHLPGPVSIARAKRREQAIGRLAAMLPPDLDRRPERAAFLMDAFLGVQLAWSKATTPYRLEERVRRDLPWAIAGAMATGTAPGVP